MNEPPHDEASMSDSYSVSESETQEQQEKLKKVVKQTTRRIDRVLKERGSVSK